MILKDKDFEKWIKNQGHASAVTSIFKICSELGNELTYHICCPTLSNIPARAPFPEQTKDYKAKEQIEEIRRYMAQAEKYLDEIEKSF